MKKDIKSQKNSSYTLTVDDKNYKSEIRNAVKAGIQNIVVKPQYEKYINYLQKCINDKKVKEELKAKKEALVKEFAKKFEEKKKKLLEVANALADRIIEKEIIREEQKERFDKIDSEAKKIANKKLKEAAKAKRERKNATRLINFNKTIPTKDDIEINKSKQDELEKAFAKATKDRKKKRGARDSKQGWGKRTTKQERIELAKKRKEEGKKAYLEEMNRQAKQIESDPAKYAENQKKREEEKARIERIALNKVERRNKLFAEKLKTAKVKQRILDHFKASEERRRAKKEEKRAKYISKGGIKVNKTKVKVPIRPVTIPSREESKAKEYLYVISRLTDKDTIVDTKFMSITCLPTDLTKIVGSMHKKELNNNNDNYVGIFVYPQNDKTHCIFEEISGSKLAINGKITSRIAEQIRKKEEQKKKAA